MSMPSSEWCMLPRQTNRKESKVVEVAVTLVEATV